MRSRVKERKPVWFKVVVIFMVATTIYLWGYSHGQSDTYDKINDKIKVSQIKK